MILMADPTLPKTLTLHLFSNNNLKSRLCRQRFTHRKQGITCSGIAFCKDSRDSHQVCIETSPVEHPNHSSEPPIAPPADTTLRPHRFPIRTNMTQKRMHDLQKSPAFLLILLVLTTTGKDGVRIHELCVQFVCNNYSSSKTLGSNIAFLSPHRSGETVDFIL